ncbi:MAG: hypothetical protein M1819_006184 [Sarea resinae]|nr:MAG: hypothetical protein M1819_006184 [Sarea resinae]
MNLAGPHFSVEKASSNHDNPNRPKRERALLSCAQCRLRKVKCDRGRPCDNCVKHDDVSKCIYIHQGGKARRSRRRASGSRKHSSEDDPQSMEEMKDRMGRLESLILSLLSQNSGPQNLAEIRRLTSDSSRTTAEGRSNGEGSAKGSDETDDHSDGDDLDTVNRALGKMTLSKGGVKYYGEFHWRAALLENPELRDLHCPTSRKRSGSNSSQESDVRYNDCDANLPLLNFPFSGVRASSADELLSALPYKNIADPLIERFFRVFNHSHHVLHEKNFRAAYESFWPSHINGGINTTNVDLKWVAMLFSILALALQSTIQYFPTVPVDTVAEHAAFSLIRAAEQSLMMSGDFTKCPQLEVVICLLFLVVARKMRRKDPQGSLWTAQGMLMRIVLSIGLHHDPMPYGTIPLYMAEMRRRLWAVMLSTDLQGSIHIGLPSTLSQPGFNTALPRNLNDDELFEEMTELPPARPLVEFTDVSYLLAKTKICRLLGRIVTRTFVLESPPPYEDILKWDAEIQNIIAETPEVLRPPVDGKHGDTPPWLISQRYALDILYQKALLLLHKPYTFRWRHEQRYAPSRRTSLDAAVKLLSHNLDLRNTSQVLWDEIEWFLETPLLHDILNASVIIYLQIIITQKPDGQYNPRADMLNYTQGQLVETLFRLHDFYAPYRDPASQRFKANKIISTMIGKLSAVLRNDSDPSLAPSAQSSKLDDNFRQPMPTFDEPIEEPNAGQEKSGIARSMPEMAYSSTMGGEASSMPSQAHGQGDVLSWAQGSAVHDSNPGNGLNEGLFDVPQATMQEPRLGGTANLSWPSWGFDVQGPAPTAPGVGLEPIDTTSIPTSFEWDQWDTFMQNFDPDWTMSGADVPPGFQV